MSTTNNRPNSHQISAEDNANYYQESCKLYLANVLLTCQVLDFLKELQHEKDELLQKIERMESSKKRATDENNSGVHGGGGGSNSNFTNEKKRVRRNAVQIERNYRCPIANCEKRYGSENSLIQHVKLKHPEADIKAIINQINKNSQMEENNNHQQQNDDSSDDDQDQGGDLQKKHRANSENDDNDQNNNNNEDEDEGDEDDEDEEDE